MSSREWSQLIQNLLVAFDFEPKELARRARVSSSTVNRWIEGTVAPRPGNQMKVVRGARATSLDDLEDRIEQRLRAKEVGSATDVHELRTPKESETEEFLRVIRFLKDPGTERRHLIADIDSLQEVRNQALDMFNGSLEMAKGLLNSVRIIEERTVGGRGSRDVV